MGVEFRALGPFEVLRDGASVPLGGPKQRCLLAILLINSNEVVSVDRLVEELWGDEAPATAENTIQVYVSHLRKAIQPGDGTERLQTLRPGYLLRVGADEFDASRVEGLVEEGRALLEAGNPEGAASRLLAALGLFRGQPLSDFAYEAFAQAEISRLDEIRMNAQEAHIEAQLALGHHVEMVAELRRLVSSYPLRETMRAQLMLALYRSGRQAEALSAYEEARSTLEEELGIDPGPALQTLQRAVLNQDGSLELPGHDEVREAQHPSEDLAPDDVPRERRRHVTVVACEVEARSAIGDVLDPEQEDRLLSLWLDVARPVFERHGGRVAPAVGGALVAIFGVPIAHEDDALRAVRAATELPVGIAAVVAQLERDWKARLSVRTALAGGEVVSSPGVEASGLAGPGGRAFRLAQAAPPGEVVVDAGVYRAVKNEVEVEPVGTESVESASAFRLLNFRATLPGRSLRFNSPIVGRAEELELLRDAYARSAVERTCVLFTILGDAGVGKSRLVHEFLSQEHDQMILRGRCLPYGEGVSLRPVIEAVAEAAAISDRDDPALAREKIASLVAGSPDAEVTIDRIAQAIGLVEGSAPPGETFWGIRKFLEALAMKRPLTVVFDDIHWAEPVFLDLIEYVAELAVDAPIFLICMARPELTEQREDWGEGANATSLLLEVLDERNCSTLIDNLLGGVGLDEDVRSKIVAFADGNPFFVEELLSKLVDEGFLHARDGRWEAAEDAEKVDVPPTIQALLDARLDGLTLGEGHVLACASVVGQEFSAEAVEYLLPERLAPSAKDILVSLVRRDLVRPRPAESSGDAYSFRHMLIQEAAYRGLPKMSRASLHERYADHLEETTREQTAENQEIVGYHLAQACDYRSQLGPADEDHEALAARASSRLAVGGRRALARGDHLGAVKLLTRAAGLLSAGKAERTTVLPDLGEGLVRLGRFDDAEKVLLEAIESASDSGDEATRWRSVLELCDARFFSDPGASYKRVLAEVDQAMRWFESADDDLGLARAFWILAGAHFVTGRAGAADEYLVRAIEHARRGGSLRLVGRLLTSLSGALIDGPCPAPDGIARLHQALPDLEENRLGRAVTLLRLGTFHAMTGDFDEGRSLIAEGRDILRDLGATLLGTMVTAWEAAHLERLAGENAAARVHLLEGFAELKKIGDKAYLPTLAAMLAHVLCSLERFDEAAEVATLSEREAATGDMVSQILWRGARAKLLAHAGDIVAAQELAAEATRIAEGTDFLEIMADALMDEAEIARAAGNSTESSDAARRALALYERKGNDVSVGRARVAAGLATSAERNE